MNILLLTGAIDINKYKTPFTKLINLDERLAQYIYSIEYAINNYKSITHIVFCENTNFVYDYSFLKNIAIDKGKELEVLSFDGNSEMIQRFGKGYGEGEIINYALEKSVFLTQSDTFFKLTGRLIISNMDFVIRFSKQRNAFLFYPADIYASDNHLSTVFYKVDRKLYIEDLKDLYLEVNDYVNIYLEHLFYLKLKNRKIKSFMIFPFIIGQSGSTCESYQLSFLKKTIEIFVNFFGVHDLHKKPISALVGSVLALKKKKNNIFLK